MSGYWSQFIATASFLEPCEITGILEGLETFKSSDGPAPQLLIRTPIGGLVKVNVVQEQLLYKLQLEAPEVGDRIRIRYLGEAEKAAPGMSPTKRFSVEVRRAEKPT
jgi:hypothetical protein